MDETARFLFSIGALLLLGLLTTTLAKRTPLPRVTLLLIFGAILGQQGLDLIPGDISKHFDLVANMTLLMVGFLLGGKLTRDFIGQSAREILSVSVIAAIFTAALVTAVLMFAGVSLQIAVILGCIAAATDAAAVLDVVNESSDNSQFSKKLLSIVALDDAWGLVLFALGLSFASLLAGHQDGGFVMSALHELIGAILLGCVLGFPASKLTGRYKEGQPMVSEALGLVFLCGGIAMWLEFSFLIAAIVMGAVIANRATHHEYPFHAIENIESPFLVIFFILAGASLELSALAGIGLIGLLYVVFRSLGKIGGAWLGGLPGRASRLNQKWMGIALLPQAGVAIGMALVASSTFPEHRQLLLSIVISSTVLFEIIGPVLTRLAIRRAGEIQLIKE